ncbi:Coenzyme F420 hydrogenase/dehydrogenase, beta subunit C-terminal domain [Desulfofalx alkaliphila]|uniref:Coenzyme F420 hydrogenase/dehydrogenase, beta subunit C-terminal domain n=1 Tax=Desulfofalx alkaliphila TaxID=105483 RepID=UPI0004E0C932|nr:Coenzyme F420 hydrogenase/dehydrogenase, beta subunit C-terminal domain [Desulfofalx alkaliphila]
MKKFILKVENNNPPAAVAGFMKNLLAQGVVEALMLQQNVKGGVAVQTLVRDPQSVDDANPLAPISLQNAARLVADLTYRGLQQKVGVVLRSCEVRALVELVKLQQANMDNLVIIGVDCLGTFDPGQYRELIKAGKLNAAEWLAKAANGQTAVDNIDVRLSCRICNHVTAEHADLHIGWVGMDVNSGLLVEVDDGLADQVGGLGLSDAGDQAKRNEAVQKLIEARTETRNNLLAEYSERFNSMDKLMDELSACIKCSNCRQSCPICFCRECVFLSPIFQYDAEKYLQWAERKGRIEMPTDTVLFHLTRVNHMGASCVGCGQCESACPSNIPVGLMFQVLGSKIQDIFEYVPGRDLEEALPLSTYKEVELEPR